MKKLGFILIGLLCIAFLGFLSIETFADTTGSENTPMMQVAPVIEEISLGPSTQTEKSIQVANQGSQALKVRVYATPYSVSSETGASDFETQSEFTQIYHWLKIKDSNSNFKNEAEFTIGPGKTEIINYQINVPNSAPGGSQHACLFVETIPDDKQENGITTVSRAAVKIFAEVSGETEKDAEVLGLKTDTFVIGGKVSVSSLVKNIGNIDIKPTLTLKINSLGGETIFSDTKVTMIFPENSSELLVDWPDTPAFGMYNLVASVNVLGKNAMIEKTIFILPTWFIVIFILIVIATIISFVHFQNIRKNKKRRAKRQKGSSTT